MRVNLVKRCYDSGGGGGGYFEILKELYFVILSINVPFFMNFIIFLLSEKLHFNWLVHL